MTTGQKIKTGWTLLRLFLHILRAALVVIIMPRGHFRPDSRAACLSMRWHKKLASLFQVKLHCEGKINSRPTLFIANHISWFDIPAVGACVPVRFLSKQEVRHWPLIGWLADKLGTLFIRRGTRGAAEQSIDDIRSALQQGEHVIIFPEGTTSDGRSLKRFHSRLFQSAIDADADIQAIAICYPDASGIHPQAAYVGDMSMLESTLNFIHGEDIRVQLTFLDVLHSSNYTRDELASLCQQKIAPLIEEHH